MIAVTQEGKVAVVYLQHGKANVMDVEFCEALVARLDELRQAPSTAVILTGQGTIFSAGVDLRRVLDGGADYLQVFLPALARLFTTVFFYPKPVVAAVNGHAIAGGCVLACAADDRLMAQPSGRIGIPELLVGVAFPSIALEIIRFAVAPQYVQNLLYSGATLSPEDALTQGLVDTLVAPETLLEHARQRAEARAALSPAAFALTKRQLRRPVQQRVQDYGAECDATMQQIWADPQTQEAIRAYIARTLRR